MGHTPSAFAVGMALLDTLDGVMMLGAYGWAFLKPARKLYYNVALTFASVLIALFIGAIEALQVLIKTIGSTGGILNNTNTIQLEGLGFCVVGIFAASWIASMVWYKWRGYERLA